MLDDADGHHHRQDGDGLDIRKDGVPVVPASDLNGDLGGNNTHGDGPDP